MVVDGFWDEFLEKFGIEFWWMVFLSFWIIVEWFQSVCLS